MSMAHDRAEEAVEAILAELPVWMGEDPDLFEPMDYPREVEVKTRKNIRKVHQALWELKEYLGME